MRITLLGVAFLCAAADAGLAQGAIEWSPARRLARDDFKARVPPNAPSASMSWINIETEWQCEGGALAASARAMFDPARSWWRNTRGSVWTNAAERMSSAEAQLEARRSQVQLDLQLLEHEQLHFDIAEVTVRKIKARFEDFKHACAEPGGTAPIQQMVAQADRELQEEQQRYDRETGHGIDARAQDKWKRRIHALLN